MNSCTLYIYEKAQSSEVYASGPFASSSQRIRRNKNRYHMYVRSGRLVQTAEVKLDVTCGVYVLSEQSRLLFDGFQAVTAETLPHTNTYRMNATPW